MARCVITQPQKLQRLSEQTGRTIVSALVRGNTGHRIDAIEADGTIWHVWPDGTIERSEYGAAAYLWKPDAKK